MDIYIKSKGREGPRNTDGIAYIMVNGIDYSPQGRGYNVVVVDGTTGKKKTAESLTPLT